MPINYKPAIKNSVYWMMMSPWTGWTIRERYLAQQKLRTDENCNLHDLMKDH